jgi:hypothetical protein
MPRASFIESAVFDAWAWCESGVLEWRTPLSCRHPAEFDQHKRIDGQNPSNLVFVLRDPSRHSFLPTELAHLHAVGYGLDDGADGADGADGERALAPWGIDDATDLLFEHRARPHDVFWLAASSLDALVWGLHDWVHFHNHGPFDQPAMTELQCDVIALAWLKINRVTIGIGDAHVEEVARDLAKLSRQRFSDEGIASPVDDLDRIFQEALL